MWMYNEKTVSALSDIPDNVIGFVYLITNRDTGKYYVGKKSLYGTRKLPPLKGQRRKRTVTKESNWLTYMSSNKDVQKWKNVDKSILEYAYSKKELTYLENKALYCLGVLEDEHSMNGNIAGKFYKDEFTTPV
jgi:hypothetical protein